MNQARRAWEYVDVFRFSRHVLVICRCNRHIPQKPQQGEAANLDAAIAANLKELGYGGG